MNLEQELYTHFGYHSFRSGQKEVIQSLLEGNNTLAMLATGTGKSICYQLASKIIGKPTVIVSPLISLMQDQVEQLKLNGEKRVIALNSFLTQDEKYEALQNMNRYRFIFLSPEMLMMSNVISAISQLQIGLFVIDEAHCISQWGFDFRPDYLNLGGIRRRLNYPLTLALTATATEQVRKDIKHFLQIESCTEIVTSVNRSNIGLFVEKVHSYDEKEERLVELVKRLKKPGIIYFLSKKAAEEASVLLRSRGIDQVGVYHAGMEQEQRVLIQQQFLQNQLQIICATSAFGMGINKENVKFIIHFHLPPNMEAYLQEIGRAGRDGQPSAAILLYCEGDESLPLFLLERELPTEGQMNDFFDELVAQNRLDVSLLPVPQVIDRMGFTETQERLIRHYLQQEGTLLEIQAGLIEHIRNTTERKRMKWQLFFKWILQKSCYRRGILHYFDENEDIQQSLCCSNCGDQIASYYSEDEGEQSFSLEEMDWKEELAAFLLPKRAVDDEE
ncbi:RecQ family ATP-dependent DNA helicase [Bacillus massiliigorillae]|uniref:RecQ family ATP-dependent DNA helicase n=1 Tax=Bacillus massiliigorillae TaxID=1243664 RepID=UPI000399F392|nr:RecQ family ATP-dependent DNA helicase [Bacillus massiliigorillae]